MREIPFDPDDLDFLEDRDRERLPAQSQKLIDAVESLPQPHRRVIEALWWEQIPKTVLARELGFQRRWVYDLHRQALQMLKDRLCDANGS